MIAGGVDTGDKFIAGDNNTGEQLSAVTKDTSDKFTVGDNYAGVKGVWGVYGHVFSWRFDDSIAGRVRLRRPKISPFWFEVVLLALGVSNQGVWDVYGRVFSWRFECNYWLMCPTPAARDIAVFSGRHPCSCQAVRRLAERTDLCRHISRREITPFWFWWPQGPQGPLIRVCEVSMDASFHGDSNDTIGGCV